MHSTASSPPRRGSFRDSVVEKRTPAKRPYAVVVLEATGGPTHSGGRRVEHRLLRPDDMAALINRRFTERIFSLGSIGALVTGMAMVDDTFRVRLAGAFAGGPSNALASAAVRSQRLVRVVMETASQQGTDHASLVLFGLAALVLLLLMLRM